MRRRSARQPTSRPQRRQVIRAIVAGPDGNLWFTEFTANKIGMLNPATHAITEFAVPTADSGPLGIAVGDWHLNRWSGRVHRGRPVEQNGARRAADQEADACWLPCELVDTVAGASRRSHWTR